MKSEQMTIPNSKNTIMMASKIELDVFVQLEQMQEELDLDNISQVVGMLVERYQDELYRSKSRVY